LTYAASHTCPAKVLRAVPPWVKNPPKNAMLLYRARASAAAFTSRHDTIQYDTIDDLHWKLSGKLSCSLV